MENKTVVITGAASGIGWLCAKRYANEGANVVMTDIDEKRLEACAAEIRTTGGIAQGVAGDVRVYGDVQNVCDTAAGLFGGIDILVNCAGGASSRIFGCDKAYFEYPVEYLDWGIDVNLKGPMYFSRAAMAHMVKKQSGVIVVMGSIAGEEGTTNSVDYSAAKSALMNGFLKSMAQCGAPYNIRVCAVSPGPVLTRAAMGAMKTLLGRAAEPSEIVDLIFYLTSSKAAFITGANYMIDGGRSYMLP